jgi:hypothetical protein
VEFASKDSVDNALKLDNSMFKGRQLKVLLNCIMILLQLHNLVSRSRSLIKVFFTVQIYAGSPEAPEFTQREGGRRTWRSDTVLLKEAPSSHQHYN